MATKWPLTVCITGFEQACETHAIPGAVFGLYMRGELVAARCYGLATLDFDVPTTPSTRFLICSGSKQFTAACAARLIDEGRLDLDDLARTYVPELPAYAADVRVRHLIHHTSGLRDHASLLRLADRDEPNAIRTPDDVFAVLGRQRGLNFDAGSDYMYSNTGYVVLGLIVERIAGVPFDQYCDATLFSALDMRRTCIHADPWLVLKDRAQGYLRRADCRPATASEFCLVGSDGVHTTVEDLANWERAFYQNGTHAGDDFSRRLVTPGTLDDGSPIAHAYGLDIRRYRGEPAVASSGESWGFKYLHVRLTLRGFSAAVLCNAGWAPAQQICSGLLDAYLGDSAPPRRPRPPDAQGSTPAVGDLRPYEGTFRSDEADVSYTFSVSDNQLVVGSPRRLEPLRHGGAGESFAGDDRVFEFTRTGSHLDAVLVSTTFVKRLRFRRIGTAE